MEKDKDVETVKVPQPESGNDDQVDATILFYLILAGVLVMLGILATLTS